MSIVEMARLQKNALYFKLYTQILASDLAQYPQRHHRTLKSLGFAREAHGER